MRSCPDVVGEQVMGSPVEGAARAEAAQGLVLEAQKELGALLEALGVGNVGCRQTAGVSQAARHRRWGSGPVGGRRGGGLPCPADYLTSEPFHTHPQPVRSKEGAGLAVTNSNTLDFSAGFGR